MAHYKYDSFFVCEILIGLFAVMVVFHTVLLAMLGDSSAPIV